jgi:glycosyltransferase involved in cell wall biosynthesis
MDGIEDYCAWLGNALARRGCRLEHVRVPWMESGWLRAFGWLWREATQWQGRWVLVQYTALGWSRRGFPVWLLLVLIVLRWRSCRVGIVFHDASGFPGDRWIDRVRRVCQHWVMRRTYQWSECSLLNIPVDRANWLPKSRGKAFFIPVGANVPQTLRESGCRRTGSHANEKTVVIFGVTGGQHTLREVADIALAVQRAAARLPRVHLAVVGRGSREAEHALRRILNGVNIEVSVLGSLPAACVSDVLARADAMLFVRGPLTSQRGSGIAGIACGLPIVGYAGPHTGPPLTDAGVMLVPYEDREALAEALARVLSDEELSLRLRERSVQAYRRHFSWDAIADHFVQVLRL